MALMSLLANPAEFETSCIMEAEHSRGFPGSISPDADENSRRIAQQALIAEFGFYALRQHSLDAILAEACRVAAQGLQVTFAKVLELLAAENALLLRAGVGWKAGLVGRARVGADLESPAGYTL